MTTQTIRNGTSIEVVIPTGQTLKVVAVSGTYNASVVRGTGIGTTLSTLATGASYGPYAYDSVVRLVSSDASEIDFDVAVTPVVGSDTEPKFAFDSTGAVTGLVGPGGVDVPLAITLGVVGNRCSIPTGHTSASNAQMMSRTKHTAMDSVTKLKIAYANFWADVGVESTPGASTTYTAGIEYPIGTVTAVTFSNGSNTGVATDGSIITSDWVNITIPRGATFFVRTWQSNSTGVVWVARRSLANQAGVVPTSGEWHTIGLTTTDYTKAATNVNNGSTSNSFVPLAILGYTKRPSFLIVGDSRSSPAATNETIPNSVGATGEVERSIAKGYGSINASDPGETLLGVSTTSFTRRLPLANWCTHIIIDLGINDFTAGKTSTQAVTYLNTICDLLPGKSIFACTVSPKSASTDSWTTTVNQTADATSNANRIAYNGIMRTNPPPKISATFDVADQTESSRDSGLWRVNGAANGYTLDGLHGNSTANAAIETSQIFSAVQFF